MTNSEQTLEQTYYVVLPLLRRAGQMLLARQRGIAALDLKARHARGREIEDEIQTFLADTLQQLFPTYGVRGRQPNSQQAEYQWVVVPLDGSRYYFRGLPLFTISLALRQRGEVMLGVVVQPTTGNVFHARKGDGAFLNDDAITVSEQKEWPHASAYVAGDGPIGVALRAVGADCYDLGIISLGLCYLAAGVFDVLYTPLHDADELMSSAAGLLIAREAGATLGDGAGKSLSGTSKSLLISVPGLTRKAVSVVAS